MKMRLRPHEVQLDKWQRFKRGLLRKLRALRGRRSVFGMILQEFLATQNKPEPPTVDLDRWELNGNSSPRGRIIAANVLDFS